MTVVNVETPSRAYQVHIGAGLLAQAGTLAASVCAGRRAAIVTDDRVGPLCGRTLAKSLQEAGFSAAQTAFPAGEASKTPETLTAILNFLAAERLDRTDAVFALGGGVPGDCAGLAAALYLRGVTLVQVPTTVLAAVDSSVGGKTAVDLPAGKNLMGAFYQPSLVLCDTDALKTLPAPERANGCAEIVKTAFLSDPTLLDALDGAPDWEDVIARCVRFKGRVVAADEREAGPRQLLNFGHTFGHAVEQCSRYALPHGSAVAVGMALMTRAAVKRGLCPPEALERLTAALEALGLPTKTEYSAGELFAALLADKKRAGDTITLIVPRAVGRCERRTAGLEEVRAFLEQGLEAAP